VRIQANGYLLGLDWYSLSEGESQELGSFLVYLGPSPTGPAEGHISYDMDEIVGLMSSCSL